VRASHSRAETPRGPWLSRLKTCRLGAHSLTSRAKQCTRWRQGQSLRHTRTTRLRYSLSLVVAAPRRSWTGMTWPRKKRPARSDQRRCHAPALQYFFFGTGSTCVCVFFSSDGWMLASVRISRTGETATGATGQ